MENHQPGQRVRIPLLLQACALAIPVAFCVYEWTQWRDWPDEQRTFWSVLLATSTGPYLVWLALAPLAVCLGRLPVVPRRLPLCHSGAACFLLTTALGTSLAAWYGWSAKELPFAYHDEYSYEFQARTFLAGRLSFEPDPYAKAFDQIHVLNEEVYASRYFPGTGLWFAPFFALGLPVCGGWIAHGLTAGFAALTARRLSMRAGWLTGLLVATSPAMLLLANLILSPMPTMLGMAAFTWAYFRQMDSDCLAWPAIAGFAIGFAFLCRPLTAAGLGYPFALYSLAGLVWPRYRSQIRRRQASDNPRLRRYLPRFFALTLSFALPVVVMGAYNAALTGSPFSTPYGVYLKRHTPSHVYGFYNQQRGQAVRGGDTHLAYDEWSEDLTWPVAFRLAKQRIWGLVRWSLGAIATLTLIAVFCFACRRWDDRLLLTALSVAGLMLAYFPYGHPGLFGWGYLFEATPPLLLCLAIAGCWLADDWQDRGLPWIGVWQQGIWAVAVVVNLLQTVPAVFEPGSELMHPRMQAARQHEREKAASKRRPILVLVDARQKDSLHSTFVHNRPTLDGPVVRAWASAEATERLISRFPERSVYYYRPADDVWQLIRPAGRN